MSPREKNLLIFLGATLFIILNFVGYSSFYSPLIKKAESEKRIAEKKLKLSEIMLSQGEDLEPDIQWLERSGAVTAIPTTAQSKLDAELRKQASNRKVEMRNSQILPFQAGEHFTRVRVLCKVAGTERNVFTWLTSIHKTNQRQVITKMELKPMRSDLTRVECDVEVEKWIIVPEEI